MEWCLEIQHRAWNDRLTIILQSHVKDGPYWFDWYSLENAIGESEAYDSDDSFTNVELRDFYGVSYELENTEGDGYLEINPDVTNSDEIYHLGFRYYADGDQSVLRIMSIGAGSDYILSVSTAYPAGADLDFAPCPKLGEYQIRIVRDFDFQYDGGKYFEDRYYLKGYAKPYNSLSMGRAPVERNYISELYYLTWENGHDLPEYGVETNLFQIGEQRLGRPYNTRYRQ